jgi:uncharacterized Zn ribbon protein
MPKKLRMAGSSCHLKVRTLKVKSIRMLNAVDHIQNGSGGLEARMTQKELM